ncbi:MAG TPA: protein-L-isoaspartate O-methyltransferase [Salinarimonas sp.]|nr:protein-L-isoaspartate O-methyltransferase [Salinarimonas sp.]
MSKATQTDICAAEIGMAKAPSGLEEAVAFVMSLRSRGVRDLAVLGAMERVPRSFFAPRRFADLAPRDIALPLEYGQTMTAPSVVAAMLVALELRPGDAVFEIGTGSGYVAGLLAQMGGSVTTVERHEPLAASAADRLTALAFGGSVRCEIGDGLAPVPDERFARIIVNGALPGVPPSLTERLAPGGRLVLALARDGFPRLATVARDREGRLVESVGGPLRIGPIVAPDA